MVSNNNKQKYQAGAHEWIKLINLVYSEWEGGELWEQKDRPVRKNMETIHAFMREINLGFGNTKLNGGDLFKFLLDKTGAFRNLYDEYPWDYCTRGVVFMEWVPGEMTQIYHDEIDLIVLQDAGWLWNEEHPE